MTHRGGTSTERPTAAPAVWPYLDHRTVAETDKPRFLRAAARKARLDYILALKARGITQAAIAERMGISDARVSQILTKARHPVQQRTHQVTDRAGEISSHKVGV